MNKPRMPFHGWLAVLGALVSINMAHAQDTGVAAFFHRAGAAIQQGAGTVLHGNASGAQMDASGVAVTTGDLYKPLSPSHGEFVGLFNGTRNGQQWPRAALTFTSYGTALPCWTVRATIWHSVTTHHDETFQVCNAPIMTTDAVGNPSVISGNTAYVWMRKNIPGITHVPSSPTRTTGPNPPESFFAVAMNAGPLETQYKNILLRLAWVSGSINRRHMRY